MILLFGCCGTLTPDDEKIEYLVYETDTYAIEYPEDWNVLIHDDGEFDENYSFVKFKSKWERNSDPVLETLDIAIQEDSELMTFEDFELMEILLLYEGEEVVRTENITFANQNALLLIVEGNMDGTEITYHVIYFQHDGKTYRIQSVSEDAKQDKYAPIFQRMKDSFELK